MARGRVAFPRELRFADLELPRRVAQGGGEVGGVRGDDARELCSPRALHDVRGVEHRLEPVDVPHVQLDGALLHGLLELPDPSPQCGDLPLGVGDRGLDLDAPRLRIRELLVQELGFSARSRAGRAPGRVGRAARGHRRRTRSEPSRDTS